MLLRAVLPTMALAGMIGCSGGDAPQTDGKPAGGSKFETRDTLVVATQSDVGQLISLVNETAADSYVLGATAFPLLDAEFDCSLKRKPGLATEWEWSEDGKVLKMTLRDDLTWQDGTKVTPADIAFTYELAADPKVASARINHVENMVEGARPKIIDDTHIEWHFTRAYDRDTQAAHAGLVLMPKHIFKDADRATLRGHERSKNPLAYGPFKLAKYEPNTRIVLEPNEKFTGPDQYRPKLNRIVYRVIPEYSTRLIELEAGKVDMMEAVLVADADKLRKEHPEIKLVRRGWRSNDYIAWNLKKDIFKDVKVRRAMSMAMSREAMIDKVLKSDTGEVYAKPSVSTITPALCGVHNDDIKPLPYDVEKAKALMAEAGWKDTDGDGFVDKDGKKFSFVLSTNTGNQRRQKVSVIAQSQLKEIGIDVTIERTESNTFFENLRKRDYDAALGGWSAGLFIDPSNVWGCDPEDPADGLNQFNFTSYCNKEVDALIEKGLNTPNPKEAAPIWKEMQAKIYDDQPYAFLWWMDEIVAIHERFENAEENINILSPYANLHEWEVPPEKVKYKR